MESSCVELSDLPNEILLMIFKKLNNLEALYSFQGVNDRLNQILHDPIFTSRLNFLKWSSNKLINRFSSHIICHRFCLQILPEISMKIKWLDLELSSIKHVLRAADYPNLYGLGLYNIRRRTVRRLCMDKNLSSDLFKRQITTLVIGIDPNQKDLSTMENICNHILTVFSSLTHLIFSDMSYQRAVRLILGFSDPRFSSSTLLVLNIKVQIFDTCLYILDGRFSQLHTLYIDLMKIYRPHRRLENQVKIANLKCFSLTCASRTSYYNEAILPLLHRMSNLEKLHLDLTIFMHERFIDGNNLKENILNCMTQLKEFTFNIHSIISINNQMNFSSKENIQETFRDFEYTKIICCADYFLEEKKGHCHVYSYPFLMQHYDEITNNFPGGLYPYVRVVSLYDERAFEHEFFLRIKQSFPFMQSLSLINRYGQNHKQSYQLMNDDSNLSIVKYCYLTELYIRRAHDDYIEEFLCNTKTCLQNDISLDVDFKSLERVTHSFTRNDTRINSGKINKLFLHRVGEYDCKIVQDYFPFTEISGFPPFSTHVYIGKEQKKKERKVFCV